MARLVIWDAIALIMTSLQCERLVTVVEEEEATISQIAFSNAFSWTKM